MNDERNSVAPKGKTKIVLAIISMVTAISISVFSLIGQQLDKGEVKAEKADKKVDETYKHLVEQVRFTDKQLIEIRKEMNAGDKEIREMVFNLTLAIKEKEKPIERVRSRPNTRPTASTSLDDIFTNAKGFSEDGSSSGATGKIETAQTSQIDQRPMLPDNLEELKTPKELEDIVKKNAAKKKKKK